MAAKLSIEPADTVNRDPQVSVNGGRVTLQVDIELGGSMLEMESSIQDAVNTVGSLATHEALVRFDTDGTGIDIGGQKWSSKGRLAKVYQTPYGEVEVQRHVYQGSRGGKTYCPLERDARIVVTSTPRFANAACSGPSSTSQSGSLEQVAVATSTNEP